MTRIYKQAQGVLVFIGNPLDDDLHDYDELFHYIKTKRHRGGGVKYIKKTIKRRPDSEKPESICDILSTNWSPYLRLRDTLVKFLSYSWFYRIWIIQEVIMAQAVTLYWDLYH